MRSLLACLVVLSIATVASSASAHVPGSKEAVFDLIVEGKGKAGRAAGGSGSNGVCGIITRTESKENYTYGRGKGVRVVFTKLGNVSGAPIILRRSGRRTASFAVVGDRFSEAVGTASRAPAVAGACPALTETVGDEQDCGWQRNLRVDLGLVLTGRKLELDVAKDRFPGLLNSGCGSNAIETVSGESIYGWGGFVKLKPATVSERLIFGRRRAFKVEMSSGPARDDAEPVAGAVTIRRVDTGEHSATVRFVRVKRD